MQRIAATVIAGDEVERANWDRMVASLAPYVREIFLSWNGESFKPPRWMRSCKLPVVWTKTPWQDDFAEQRNASFALVPREQYDWILWIDTDDELVAPEGLEEMFASLDEYTTGVFLRYQYVTEGDTSIVQQYRERFLSTAGTWVWLYPVHETCQGAPGTQYARREEIYIKHHKAVSGDATRARNRRILVKARKTIEHPRITFQLANETYAEAERLKGMEQDPSAEMNAAIQLYKKFIEMVPWEDDAYIANHHIADILRDGGRHHEAIDQDLQGVKVRPTWPDAYNGIAMSCLELGDMARCRDFATIAIETALTPGSTQTLEPLEMTYTPYWLRASAYEGLGDLASAIADFEKAAETWSPPDLQDRIARLRQRQLDEIDGTNKIDELRKSLRGRPSEKSIAFFQRPLFEPWHPILEKEQGAGGSETCIMRLAKRFAADGWRTVVFGTPGEHAGVDDDGVEWWDSSDYLAREEFTVLVSSRAPELFDADVNAQAKILWMHDVNSGAELQPQTSAFGDRRTKPDAIVALTPWHKHHLTRLYEIDPSRIVVIPNGIDIELFPREPETRTAPRFVYSSSPDRGVEVLLGLWDEILERWPDAKLDVFYGWEAIDRIIEGNLPGASKLKRYKTYVKEEVERFSGSVNWVGRIPQTELAHRLYDSTAWLYPTYFCETFCCVGDTPIDCPRDFDRFPDGVPISQIKQGQLVWTFDEHHEAFELSRVSRVWKTQTNVPVFKLKLDTGKEIRATPDHPVLKKDGTWCRLDQLKPGDSMMALQRDFEPRVKLYPHADPGHFTSEYRQVAKKIWVVEELKGMHVHHVRIKHANTSEENLALLPPAEHASITNKGRVHSKEANRRKSEQAAIRWDELSERERRSIASKKIWESKTPEERAAWGQRISESKTAKNAERRLQNHKVVSVEFDGFDDVWDMEVEDNANFVVHGIVMHNCITALEMQAAGVIPVVSQLAGLEYTVACQEQTVSGWPNNRTFQREWIKLLERTMATLDTDEMRWRQLKARDFALSHDWDLIYQDWLGQIDTIMALNGKVILA